MIQVMKIIPIFLLSKADYIKISTHYLYMTLGPTAIDNQRENLAKTPRVLSKVTPWRQPSPWFHQLMSKSPNCTCQCLRQPPFSSPMTSAWHSNSRYHLKKIQKYVFDNSLKVTIPLRKFNILKITDYKNQMNRMKSIGQFYHV